MKLIFLSFKLLINYLINLIIKNHHLIVLLLSYLFFISYNNWVASWLLYILFVSSSLYLFLFLSIHTYSWLLLSILLSVVCSFYNLTYMLYFNDQVLYFGDFLVFRVSSINYGVLSFYFNNLNTSFFLLTLIIGFFANIFTYVYMRSELLVERFVYFLNLFIISMSLLLLSGNWLTLLLGWELIGISSYLLINFWVIRVSTFKAAFKAFIFNKLSDVCLLTSLIIFSKITLDYSFNLILISKQFYITSTNSFFGVSQLTLFVMGLVGAAFCKSAQFGFHIWLPDSMEAPIPASALIHSATLVSAGIFLLLKFWVFIKYTYIMYYFIMFWGSLTACFGALIAATQTDLKKILAYSTISHCGYLVCSLFLENWVVTVSYLYVHGIFKAFSFMALGNIIYGAQSTQDLLRLSNMFRFKQGNFFFLSFSLLNLSAMPLTLGFFFKHMLTANYYVLNNNYLYFNLILLTSLVGILYSARILYNLFFSYFKQPFKLHNTGYYSYRCLFKYNLLNIDWVLSIMLFLGMAISLVILIKIYNLGQTYFNTFTSVYISIQHNLISLKFYLSIYSYLYILIVYFFYVNNFQEYLFGSVSICSTHYIIILLLFFFI